MKKKLLKIVIASFVVIALSSCATTNTANQPAAKKVSLKEPCSIEHMEDAFFWKINGTDKNGEHSAVYVLGSIHLGDQRLFPLAGEIDVAFNEADRIVSELSSEDWSDLMFATLVRQGESGLRENKRVRETMKPLADYLTDEQKNFLLSIFGSEQALITMLQYEPWVLASNVNLVPMNMSGLSPMSGIDTYLLQMAMMAGRSVEGLDSLDTQLDILSYGDWNTQLAMLIESIDTLINNPQEAVSEVVDLYEAYLAADFDKFEQLFVSEMLSEDAPDYMEEYYKQLILDRNKDWADKFAEYIYEGGETFVFAGSGHFIGDNSVFEFMKENGTLK